MVMPSCLDVITVNTIGKGELIRNVGNVQSYNIVVRNVKSMIGTITVFYVRKLNKIR